MLKTKPWVEFGSKLASLDTFVVLLIGFNDINEGLEDPEFSGCHVRW